MTALITGAGGFAGGWLAKALLERGERVVALEHARSTRGRSSLAMLGIEADVIRVHGDVRGADAIEGAITQQGVDTVFHLAARAIVGTAASPAAVFETNVFGTWVVLEACRTCGVDRVVVASSDKAYGAHPELPYREELPLRPTAPYEASKAAADLIARSYWSAHGLPVAVTRFANMYGGADTHWSRLIPEAVTAALDGRRPVLRSDGSPQRDFLYVEDAASAYLAVADALDRDEVRGEAFNAGGGRAHPVGEVVELVARLAETGVEAEIRGSGNPPGEIGRQWLDSSKLHALTGWKAAVSLEDGLRRTITWYRDHPDVRPPSRLPRRPSNAEVPWLSEEP